MSQTPETTTEHTDVVIIGAGPVGLFAVFECGMLGLKCHVVDALEMPGPQSALQYAGKTGHIDNGIGSGQVHFLRAGGEDGRNTLGPQ